MKQAPKDMTAEEEIRAVLDNWLDAVRAGDVDRICTHYAEDLRAFDAVSRLQFAGRESYREHWGACLAAAPGPTVFELHDVHIEVDGGLAFSHFLSRCGVIEKDQSEKTSWFRGTQCYRRTADGWQIVHEHFSLPFDMETGAMLFDATP